MASIKELFIKSVSEGMKAAEMIPDAASKANAYAAIANALALTNLVKGDKEEGAVVADKEVLKPASAKGKNKTKAVEEVALEETAAQEEVQAEDVEVVAELEQQAEQEAEVIGQEVFTEIWTDEASIALANEIEFISNLKEAYEEEQINECISAFSEGLFNTLDDINPLNIRGFVSFMECLIAEAE